MPKTWGGDYLKIIAQKKVVLSISALICYFTYLLIEHAAHSMEPSAAVVLVSSFAHLMRDVAISLAVAVVLLVAIEADHRKHLDDSFQEKIEDISRNVFNGVFNAEIPREYVRRVIDDTLRIKLIRDRFRVDYTLDYHETEENGQKIEFVTLQSVMKYEVRNISCEATPCKVMLSLPNPQWDALKKHVQILDVLIDDVCVLTQEHKKELTSALSRDGRYAAVEFLQRTLQPDESMQVKMTYVMAKEGEDTEVLRTSLATREMEVQMFVATNKRLRVQADAIHQGALTDETDGHSNRAYRWRTDGYLLPWQGIMFWWKVEQDELQLTPQEPNQRTHVETC